MRKNVIPALLVVYLLLLGLAAGASFWSFRLRQRYGFPFLKTYHVFVLLSFAYAAMNFIGEALAPAILAGSVEAMARIYLTVDLVTIPLLGVLFFLLFSWIVRLIGRKVPRTLKGIFWGIQSLFLAVFILAFVSYFIRGITILSYAEMVILGGIIIFLLAAAVLLLIFGAPAGNEPDRRRLARRLGIVYALSLAVFLAFLAAFRASIVPRSEVINAVIAGLIFGINLPALFYLQKSLKTWPPDRDPASPESQGLAGLSRNAGLTDREKEIIRLVALGLDNREIGKRLFISPKTVKNHMTSLYAKTGARNRVQLANRLNRPGEGPGT